MKVPVLRGYSQAAPNNGHALDYRVCAIPFQVYHKQCFKCAECGTTLNLKTCKSFNKQPYCAPHVPKTVPSYTTDSLDLQRVAENTKNQSEVGT